ncbi:hypothetical protein [Rhodoplanes sp. SY1]|uniref:hypothetical protein n=1 Tax=Rhodoplanes sp. SY1 TaxID=3166646 RepID=UPI0038B50834
MMTTLALRLRATEIVPGERLPDDWCVVLEGRAIGRIMRVQRAGAEWAWFWTLMLFPSSTADRGDAPTFEEAKAAFRRRAEAVWPFDLGRLTHLPRENS